MSNRRVVRHLAGLSLDVLTQSTMMIAFAIGTRIVGDYIGLCVFYTLESIYYLRTGSRETEYHRVGA